MCIINPSWTQRSPWRLVCYTTQGTQNISAYFCDTLLLKTTSSSKAKFEFGWNFTFTLFNYAKNFIPKNKKSLSSLKACLISISYSQFSLFHRNTVLFAILPFLQGYCRSISPKISILLALSHTRVCLSIYLSIYLFTGSCLLTLPMFLLCLHCPVT
jgi:hypothetical protein